MRPRTAAARRRAVPHPGNPPHGGGKVPYLRSRPRVLASSAWRSSCVKNCLRTGNPDGKVGRIKKGKNKGKASPVSAAKKLGCVARRHDEFIEDWSGCRRNNCEGTSLPPV